SRTRGGVMRARGPMAALAGRRPGSFRARRRQRRRPNPPERTVRNMSQPPVDAVTETLVMGFLDLINERKAAGRRELAATHKTIAAWLSERTGLAVEPRHVPL